MENRSSTVDFAPVVKRPLIQNVQETLVSDRYEPTPCHSDTSQSSRPGMRYNGRRRTTPLRVARQLSEDRDN